MSTDWRAHVTALDSTVDGFVQPMPFLVGSTAPVSLDVASWLAEAETITNPTSRLRKLPTTTETDYTDVDDRLDGSPTVDGDFINQRLQNIVRGEVYRWEVLFGASNNRRGPSLLIVGAE